MRRPIVKHYSNGEVTVVWKSGLCIHSGVCFRGLPQVFDPRRRPWIAIDGAASAAIVAQVARCPSGALSMLRDDKVSDSPRASDKGESSG